MISGLGSHQGHLVVAAAKQSPDSIQFTLNRTEKYRVHTWTTNLSALTAMRTFSGYSTVSYVSPRFQGSLTDKGLLVLIQKKCYSN